MFSKEALESLELHDFEQGLRSVLAELWAMAIWARKEKRVNEIIRRNGIERLRREFYNLLYGGGKLSERIYRFLRSTWGLGIAAITEIMCFILPAKYAMWNAKVIKALRKLDMTDRLRLSNTILRDPGYLRGKHYEIVLNFLSKLRQEISDMLGKNVDFVELDYFLYYVAEVAETPTEKLAKREEMLLISSHEEAQYYLLELGKLLGYVTYVSKNDRAKRVNNKLLGEVADLADIPEWLRSYPSSSNPENIDVIWFDSSGEAPRYAFEVSHTSDLRKDLSTLAGIADVIRKGFIVAPEERRKEFEKLLRGRPYSPYRVRLGYLSYEELLQLYEKSKNLKELLDRVGIDIE